MNCNNGGTCICRTKPCWGKLDHKTVQRSYTTVTGLTLLECKERCENVWSGCVGFSRYRSAADGAGATCRWVSATENLWPSGIGSYDGDEDLYVLGRGGCATGGGYCSDWSDAANPSGYGETTGMSIDQCAARCHSTTGCTGFAIKAGQSSYVYDVVAGKCGSGTLGVVTTREQCQAAATASNLGTIGDTPANQAFPRGCFKCTSCGGANRNKVRFCAVPRRSAPLGAILRNSSSLRSRTTRL